jgi:predicted transcriptional regulator
VAHGLNKTTLYLPDDLQRRLRDAARRADRPQADLVREALERFLADQPAPVPRSIGAGADEELTGRDSEDWLRAHWRRA